MIFRPSSSTGSPKTAFAPALVWMSENRFCRSSRNTRSPPRSRQHAQRVQRKHRDGTLSPVYDVLVPRALAPFPIHDVGAPASVAPPLGLHDLDRLLHTWFVQAAEPPEHPQRGEDVVMPVGGIGELAADERPSRARRAEQPV